MKMKSVMEHTFSQVPKAQIPRSQFNRSHGLKTTFDAGLLIPIYVDEALPGDTFNMSASAFARLATPICPIMDNLYLDFFFFAVPNRLVWNNWQKMCGEQTDPGDSTDFLVPQIVMDDVAGYATGGLADYMGLPTQVKVTHSALPMRAYHLIWNEWFRDQNLQDSAIVDKDDGPDPYLQYTLKYRGKRHDYFTSCLPWPQKGESVTLPLGTTAPVIPDPAGSSPSLKGTDSVGRAMLMTTGAINRNQNYWSGAAYTGETVMSWDDPGLVTDLSTATAATVNALREAFQLQKLYERDARGGTRYTEIIRSHFGVISPDARQQRPEYLGGGCVPVNVSPVPQTSSTDATTPQGNLAAFGTAAASGIGFVKSFTEHCIIIGMVSARADLTYQNGLNRMWSRRTRWDHYWPALAHLGEQAVLKKEIYNAGTAADEDVFGYQERYAEYRYKPSQICGKFRSNDAASLDIWHLSQEFTSAPDLNDAFIRENPPIDRVIATPDEPHFIADFYFNLKCARPMPTYSVPGLIDHF